MLTSSIDAPSWIMLAMRAFPIAALALALVHQLQVNRRLMEDREHARTHANEALRAELQRLKAESAPPAARTPSTQLATMSHELRTPLTGILGLVDVLSETPLSAEQKSYLDAIRGSGVSLTRLIDDILDLSRLDAGRTRLAAAPFDVRRLVEGVVELLAPLAQSKGLEIAASIAASTPARVVGDEQRLREVLTNLAGNAVKFTERGGVGVAVESAGDGTLAFSVTDTGTGVPPDRRQAIFEEFERGGDAAHEGAGLGLAISLRLVKLMGGELRLADNPGGGSIFSFAASLPEDRRATEAPATGDATSLAGLDVLIVAHSPFEAPFMAARLAEAGARVRRAEGEAAGLVSLASAKAFGLVIVDCALGAEAMERLAAGARTAGARQCLVLFSPFERRAIPNAAMSRFDGWLVKPVRASSLLDRLNAGAAGAGDAAETTRRALLAEDDDVNALVTERALRRLGYGVVRVHDGAEAVERVNAEIESHGRGYDVIMMDLRMPVLGGEEASRRIRALQRDASVSPTPIVALTASLPSGEQAFGPEIDLCLPKPADATALAKAFERLARPRVVQAS